MKVKKKATRPGRPLPLDRHALPALSAFLGGYLHEDYVPEHGSAEAAARAFLEVAGPEDRRELRRDLDAFTTATRGLPISEVARALRDRLGSAWIPSSRAELARLVSVLRDNAPDPSCQP